MTETDGNTNARFRWVIVCAAGLILGISMGVLANGFSAFVVPIETHFGWSRAEVAAINSFGLIGIALGGIVVGFIADYVPTRTVCLFGSIFLSITLIFASRAEGLWHFYLLFFIAGAVGGGALFAPVFALVGKWFTTSVGLAIGIASAGQALGQGLVPYAAGHLIAAFGWQAALTFIGLVAAITLIPLSFLMVEPPATLTAAASGSDQPMALSSKFVLPALSLAVLGCCTGMAVPLMHLVPLIQGVCGVAAEAGGPLLLMLAVAIVGRIFFGRLADMIGPLTAWMAATAWQTFFVFGFVFLGSLQSFWLFAPLYGFGYGGVMTGVLISVRALTPASNRASATGIVLAFGWLGHAFGGWQGGWFFDLTGNYSWSFLNAAIAGSVNLLIVGSIFLWLKRSQRTLA